MYLREAGGRIYVSADDGVHGTELWTTDGTAAGTRLVVDANPGPVGSGANPLGEVAAHRLLFVAYREETGRSLWVTDGTPAGSHLVRDLHERRIGTYGGTVSDGERLYFITDRDLPSDEPPPTSTCGSATERRRAPGC